MAQPAYRSLFADFDWPWYMPAVDEHKRLAESSELADVHVWGENADHFFPDAEALTRWIDQPSIVPFLAHLDAPAKGSFRELVVTKMIGRTRQEDGRCFETFRRINLSAVRHEDSGR